MKPVKEIIRSIDNNFFLKKHTPLPTTMQLLRDLYPSIDWSRVDFFEGLPWFTPFIASYVNAQALPQFYSFSRFSIYVRKYDELRAQCLGDIVHEGLHILQCMNFWNGYGFGIVRGFTVYYSALFAKYGYRNNPFEVPAYDQKFRFLDFCERHHQHGIKPKIDTSVFKNITTDTTLVFRKYQFKYEGNYLRLGASFVFCMLVALIKPFIDGLILLIRLLSSPFR